jgi:hypothetical protein
MYPVLLPPGVNPTAVNKYISMNKKIISEQAGIPPDTTGHCSALTCNKQHAGSLNNPATRSAKKSTLRRHPLFICQQHDYRPDNFTG